MHMYVCMYMVCLIFFFGDRSGSLASSKGNRINHNYISKLFIVNQHNEIRFWALKPN